MGREHELAILIAKGVAYHHAGLSHDVRYLIELLIDRGDVQVVCGTTTLGQGVNFPIASVIVESLSKYGGIGRGWIDLTFAEFWNIAGRAGRALQDRLGLVIFPSASDKDVENTRAFLRGEAVELASVLIEALDKLTSVTGDFDLQFVRFNREISVFLQYLAHAVRIGGFEMGAAEIEDILRSSLVYHQAREHDRRAAERLVRLTRRYVEHLQGRSLGYLALADGTGFSLSSVDFLYALQRQEHPEFGDVNFWSTGNLFGENLDSLSSVVSVLGQIPELSLGREDVGPFNPQRVAGIIRDWVEGKTVSEIADSWFAHVDDLTRRRREAGHYLYSQLVGQVPWGVGAIQRLVFGAGDPAAEATHVPSLIYYGVPSRDAVSLRMVGVPRVAAKGLGEVLQAESELNSYEDLRSWVRQRRIEDWEAAMPSGSSLSGEDCRSIWTTLTGV
jgi:helicase